MRVGGNDNGAYVFSKYNASTSKWDNMTRFNHMNASNHGSTYNWGLYGSMKYVNGKLRVGFQRRSSNKNDKYLYQNGIYYAYSDDQSGQSQWKDHTGRGFSIPLGDADRIKIYEPGNIVEATGKDQVRIVDGFDWTVTARGDIHIISKVKDIENNVTNFLHTYKPSGSSDFINTTDFAGGDQLYTAGENIYLIDIKNGRPFIQKAEGGTNDFQTIYEPTTGKSFRFGVPYIQDGILYYYMMENKSGTAQPMYVQIIDLGIGSVAEPTAPEVTLDSPVDGATYMTGDTIPLKATATDADGSIAKVNFKINDDFYMTESDAPYEYFFVPDSAGSYKITALAFDNESLRTEYSVNIGVREYHPPQISITTPSSDTTITEGQALYVLAEATDDNLDYTYLMIDGDSIRKESVAPYEWGHKTSGPDEEELLLSSGTHEVSIVAVDKQNLRDTASIQVTIEPVEDPVGLQVLNVNSPQISPQIMAVENGYVVETGGASFQLEVLNLHGEILGRYQIQGEALLLGPKDLAIGINILRIDGSQTVTIMNLQQE